MPPEAPQPRLTVVASSLSPNSSAISPIAVMPLVEDRLDDAVADAVDVGMAEERGSARPSSGRRRHADDVLHVGAAGQLGEAVLHDDQQADERPGGDAAEDAEQRRMRSPPRRWNAWARGNWISGTAKAGSGPISQRPSVVAAPVATTTGRKVRLETSGSRISSANSTPPSGVLKVAAMPAPAPADEQGDLLPGREPDGLREGRAERRADLDDRPLAADRRAAADRQRRGERLDHRHLPANVAALVEDRVHHFGHAVALGLRREAQHQKHDDQAAEDRRQRNQVAEAARRLEQVGVVMDTTAPVVEGVVDEADQGAQDDRAEPGGDADDQRQPA